MATGDKLVNLDDLKTAYDALNTAKLPVDFSGLTAGTSVTGTDLIAVDTGSTTKKVQMSVIAPTPFVVSITTGQWSGSGSDRYITVQASNVTADSILIPSYDNTSQSRLNGPVWCVPAAGYFTIHTTAIPSNTVTIMVQFVGTLGTADYQVLSDVYSKSQTDALIAQSTAFVSAFQNNKPFNGNFGGDYNTIVVTLSIALRGSVFVYGVNGAGVLQIFAVGWDAALTTASIHTITGNAPTVTFDAANRRIYIKQTSGALEFMAIPGCQPLSNPTISMAST